MDREQQEAIRRLVHWLAEEAKTPRFPRMHHLHLTDCEVDTLLNALRGAPRVEPDYSYGGVGSPTMRNLER